MKLKEVLEAADNGCTWEERLIKEHHMRPPEEGGFCGYAHRSKRKVKICFNSNGEESPKMFADSPMLVPFYDSEVDRIGAHGGIMEIWIRNEDMFPTIR